MTISPVSAPRLGESLAIILCQQVDAARVKPAKVGDDFVQIQTSNEVSHDQLRELMLLADTHGGKLSLKRVSDGVRVRIA